MVSIRHRIKDHLANRDSVAEWSFRYLRRQAQISRERMIEGKAGQVFLDEIASRRDISPSSPKPTPPQKTVSGNDDTQDDADEEWHSASSSVNILDSTDILAFRAYSQGSIGRFIIYSGGVRFVQSLTKREIWRRTFPELVEMRKPDGSSSWVSKLTLSKKSIGSQLELVFTDGEVVNFKAIKDRDGAFNAIIGFSSLRWQSLQLQIANHH